jgi:quinol monooxygenase YgiN
MSNHQIGFIVHYQVKPGCEEAWLDQGREVIEAMRTEPAFVNFFQLQDRTDPTRLVLYETWNCTKEDFLNVHMKRSYRQHYERILPALLATPREMQMNWRLVRSASKPLDDASVDRERRGFFVYFQIQREDERRFRATLDALLDPMSQEESFINYFLLQDETDSTKFAIYETWWGTEEEFRTVQMNRPYRRRYEESVPKLLARPRDIQTNWKLVRILQREQARVAL